MAINYIIKKDEDIESISKEKNLSAYLILIKNQLSFYNSVKSGDNIMIPNSYAEEVEIWIDIESKLTIVQKIYIDNKLFEHYEFHHLSINKYFDNNTFSKKNKNYNF